jgi:hypothetical protein
MGERCAGPFMARTLDRSRRKNLPANELAVAAAVTRFPRDHPLPFLATYFAGCVQSRNLPRSVCSDSIDDPSRDVAEDDDPLEWDHFRVRIRDFVSQSS